MDRRVYLTTAAGVALAGCSGRLGTETTQSWRVAFREGTSETDRTRLASTPVDPAAVSTRADVETALAVLGWNLASHEVSASVLDDIDSLADITGTTGKQLREGVDHLQTADEFITEMKDTSRFGTSAWDAATTTVHGLSEFVSTARSLRSGIDETATDLTDISETTGRVAAHVRSIQATEITLYGQYPSDLDAATTELERLTTNLTDISGQIETIRTVSAETEAVASELPMLGDRIGEVFGDLASEFDDIARSVERTHGVLGSLLAALNETETRAGEVATERYRPIHQAATGSGTTLDVTSMDTSVDAYDTSKATLNTPSPITDAA